MEPQERMVADYASTGVTVGRHPMAHCRPQLRAMEVIPARDLMLLRHGVKARSWGMRTPPTGSPSAALWTISWIETRQHGPRGHSMGCQNLRISLDRKDVPAGIDVFRYTIKVENPEGVTNGDVFSAAVIVDTTKTAPIDAMSRSSRLSNQSDSSGS